MGKPLWGAENLWITRNPTYFARTQDTEYSIERLGLHRLYPSYRSDEKALQFNGTDNYGYAAHHADFNATTNLCIEFLFKTPATIAQQWIVSKLGATSGFGILFTGVGKVAFYPDATWLNNVVAEVVLSTSTWYRGKMEFLNGAVTFKLNGSLVSTTENGTIPTNLTTNSAAVSIGAYSPSLTGNLWAGSLGYVAIKTSTAGNGDYLNPEECAGYWNFDNDLTDSSGNEHDLTWEGSQTTFSNNTSFQTIGAEFPEDQEVDLVVLDRRHNLRTGATVKLYRGNWYGSSELINQETVDAGKPIVHALSSAITENQFWLEINDPDNPDGQIIIPHIFMGKAQKMKRGYLIGFNQTKQVWGSVIPDGCGGINAVRRSQPLYHNRVNFRLLPEDKSILESVEAQWNQNRPVVFCDDDADLSKMKLIKKENPLQIHYQHRVADIYSAELNLQEVGC